LDVTIARTGRFHGLAVTLFGFDPGAEVGDKVGFVGFVGQELIESTVGTIATGHRPNDFVSKTGCRRDLSICYCTAETP
jgi:hypothetical protein